MGQGQIQTTRKYFHSWPDTDQQNLDALRRIAGGSMNLSDHMIEGRSGGPSVAT